jgi:hypothetical protein
VEYELLVGKLPIDSGSDMSARAKGD